MINSSTTNPVSKTLSFNLAHYAETLDSIAQLLKAGLEQREIKINASISACQRDVALYAQAIRTVASNLDEPGRKLGTVFLSQSLRKCMAARFKRDPEIMDIGELLEDFAFCGLDMLNTSLDCLSGSDAGSRCVMQADCWMRESFAGFESLFESVIAHWHVIESRELAA